MAWGETVNRVGGKIVYRLIGTASGFMTAVLLWLAWSGLSGDTIMGGLIMLALAVPIGWLTCWCRSSKRRLSDMDENAVSGA